MNARQQLILQNVIEKGKVTVAELAELTGVSVVTVRQDLNHLEQRDYLRRVHGFAVAIDTDNVETRMMSNFHQKKCLAEYAASIVDDGETIFIESGSTNAILARLLGEKKNLTIVTVSSYIANLLRNSQCEVILLGGILQKRSESMVGSLTRLVLEHVHFSKAFIGIDGFRSETGFTGRDMLRADVVNCALNKGATNIVLTDSTKFGQINPHPLGPTHLINHVISDAGLSEDFRQKLHALGIKVTIPDQIIM
ncbi:DeoR family transcriptional regulator [Yersinia pseudotuberculosis]|uniref:Transcriptional regulatory protein YciT n=1 Tax=Yersinia pseudotuberculosis TaxID=633 RepID=A0A0T9JHT4_YERPU|nr:MULTISPECIES: DNA-binding transcriptional regulator YciT [Yersinia pseudotuberculosis complex]PSH23871.1 DeoR family transcriptional regulator [Yersinia pseudotuberculosis]CNC66267.1 transcriptional regulatory protein YciT [Yersinia pseudotuberculosis]SUP80993.1 transcriptional regulatory protein YciT [Yersinia pseudotuberculosis]